MGETALIGESLGLMVIGMSIVFMFLMLLVAMVQGMSWLVARWAPAKPESAASAEGSAPGAATEIIAVIAAAVARYRNGRSHPG